jgi:hypothetical protein
MVIIYDSQLTEPPSSVHCFRDVTLYSKTFLKNENIIRCPKGTKSFYWMWVKKYGAHDFIDAVINEEEEQQGVSVGHGKRINISIVDEMSLPRLINYLINIKT